MKKSEICKKAQVAVLKNQSFEEAEKLEILKYLMDREDTELLMEKREAEKEEVSENAEN